MARTDKGNTARALRSRADFVCDAAGGQLAVRIRGEIDHHTAVEVRQGIDALLFERRPRRLVLDLSAVSFMDSSGLGLIMGRLSVMRELGGELVVWNPSREVLRIVTLAGMERLVRIEYPPDRASDGTPDADEPAENRRNGENHRDDDRAATVENRSITVARKASNGTDSTARPTKQRPSRKPRVLVADEVRRPSTRPTHAGDATETGRRPSASAVVSDPAVPASRAGRGTQRKETDT